MKGKWVDQPRHICVVGLTRKHTRHTVIRYDVLRTGTCDHSLNDDSS